jgi:Tol biopolymer transport system component
MSRATRPVRGSRDPYGIWATERSLAPILATIGLVIVAVLTFRLFTGDVGFLAGGPSASDNPGGPGPILTPAPSNVVIPNEDPLAEVPGSIVYAKQGSLWLQSGRTVRQLTTTGHDSMPSWSEDGQWIYYIETREGRGRWLVRGVARNYRLQEPVLMRIRADGSAPAEEIKSGRVKSDRYTWFAWMRSPVVSPDGSTVALVTDLPDPNARDVVLQFIDLASGKLTRAKATEQAPLGHQEPSWHPNGNLVLYTRNARDGARGAPAIWRYDLRTEKARAMTGPGYSAPAYSRDGRSIAATKTSALGTDIVILDAGNGTEILRVTDDGRSWSPTWSPLGDAVAFLHIENGIVDLRMVRIEGTGTARTTGAVLDLTRVSGLDGSSRPDWFIPADQLPPSPSPEPSPSEVASPSPSP